MLILLHGMEAEVEVVVVVEAELEIMEVEEGAELALGLIWH